MAVSGSQKNSGVLHNRFSMLPPITEKVLQFLAVSPQTARYSSIADGFRDHAWAVLAELNHLSGQGWIRWNVQRWTVNWRYRTSASRSCIAVDDGRPLAATPLSIGAHVIQRSTAAMASHRASLFQAHQYREARLLYGRRTRGCQAIIVRRSALDARTRVSSASPTHGARDASRLSLEGGLSGWSRQSLAAAETYEMLAKSAGEDQLLMQCLAGEQWIRAGRLNAGLKICARRSIN